MDFSSVKRMDMSLGKVKEQAALSANSYKEHYVGEKVTINGNSYVVEKFAINYVFKSIKLNLF
ncbi:hypothetical protein F1B92_08415 [Campylobacter sp. FMV-PI01]|uniref:Uncharacterized protein n=1 Tax=Campylobacter portucalensis TaxID=2608384 RepID=A0A6L5WJ34_9BACT|nr:hypothetical protein [Campylobacter portucalensis]MSN97179.1 hypothetical protein [Campylobacter portucalensis]